MYQSVVWYQLNKEVVVPSTAYTYTFLEAHMHQRVIRLPTVLLESVNIQTNHLSHRLCPPFPSPSVCLQNPPQFLWVLLQKIFL